MFKEKEILGSELCRRVGKWSKRRDMRNEKKNCNLFLDNCIFFFEEKFSISLFLFL